ncbi:PAS domain-containing protein [Clostridium cavendishii DSM 21758]|uniref:histidine kinase n=1 Tax=Clostridium cavendishii DSM 21758 TaxID=1121302 RepID=A0A1M6NR98_9CLOT|nr:ATP-binding protein [Clostridium cavendishii]SHJ98257.1 PAS domain-containing protein [Clostridium cavendishii DSM 21758]
MNKDLEINDTKKINKDLYIIRIFIPALLLIILIYSQNKNYTIFHQFVEILCVTVGAALAIISINKYNYNKNSFFTHIGLGFALTSITGIIHILNFDMQNYKLMELNFTVVSWLMTYYLENTIIFIAFLSNLRKIKYESIIILYGVLGATFFSILFGVLIFQDTIFKGIKFDVFIYPNMIIATCMLVCNIILFIKNKKIILECQSIYIMLYLIFIGIYEGLAFLYFSTIIFNKLEIIFAVHIFKYLAYYTLYEAISEFAVNRCYEDIYKELILREKEHEYYNRRLNERMRMLLELNSMAEKSKNKYSKLINSVKDSIVIFNDDKINYVNNAALELCGEVDPIKLKNKTKREFFKYLDKYSADFSKHIMLKEEKVFSYINFKNQDSEYKKIELYNISFDTHFSLLFMRDVTYVENMKSLRSHFEKYLEEEELKRDFFSNISHELRTPINVIFSALQLNNIYIEKGSLEQIDKNNIVIRQNCLRLIRTINNFIDANKISEGFMNFEVKVYNIVMVVENVAQESFKYINKTGITLIFDSDEEEVFVKCNREYIERCILNLLSNCVKYGRCGGHIWINIKTNQDFVTIIVENDGYKISDEEKPYIFDKFTKTNKSLSRQQEGSGLGLYITKALIELQDGTIKLSSNEENGVGFIIEFKREFISDDYDLELANAQINNLIEKVDIEFSDIYM